MAAVILRRARTAQAWRLGRRRRRAGRRIHDYRLRCWGHDFTLTPDRNPVTARVTGWGDGLRAHDLLVLPHSNGGTCLYEIQEIEYCRDPRDMWRSRCRFVPGSSKFGRQIAAVLEQRKPFSPPSLDFWVEFDD